MNWRPGGWVRLSPGKEAAVDAMLEALRKTGEHYTAEQWTDDSAFWVTNPGTVVFIPDDDQEHPK